MNELFDELAGRFSDGYTSDDIDVAIDRIRDATGVTLICVWEYFDDYGFGGNSELLLVDGVAVHEVEGDLWAWWSTDPAAPDAPSSPGSPQTWRGGPADGLRNYTDLGGDGSSNYATEARS